jgi:hypothetical protein
VAILDVNQYQALTSALSSTDLPIAAAWCGAVSRAIEDACRPFRFEPVTLTNQIYDAPVDQILTLRVRPVRSIASIYFRADANGVASRFEVGSSTTYLLDNTDGEEYILDADDDLTGFALKGQVRRTNSEWGYQWWRPPTLLAHRLQAQQRCLLVNYSAGFTSVPEAVQGAAAHTVTKMMRSRKLGTQVTSASLNGASYSLPAAAVGNLWEDPVVMGLLRRYMTVHVG